MARSLPALALACACAALIPSPARAAGHFEHDDCDAKFTAFVGSGAYQFSPAHKGWLGTVRLFTVLSYEAAAVHRAPGVAFWRLKVTGPDGSPRVVHTAHGTARLEGSTALAETTWDGRDARGRVVAPGRYAYTFEARFLGDRAAPGRSPSRYEDLAGDPESHEARSSTDEIVVNDRLAEGAAEQLRVSGASGSCDTQQNAPLEPGFGYSYYYGSTHGHSNFSDGGQPVTGCSSGNAYGSGNFSPANVYEYAKNAGLDFWLVNEHNHLIADAMATNAPPMTPAGVRQRYQDGRAAAAAATVNGQFVGLYGMEWGVSSNDDQGHVTLVETPVLFGWEPCTTCNGPNPECTPGSTCQFDVFTPKRYGYLQMYAASVANPSPAGALGIFCHPGSGNFDNFALDANADDAMQGIAVRSGLAFSTGETCSDTNVANSDYTPYWRSALDKGFHVGPVADHDSHCNNYGQGIPNRTVYVVPTASGLTRTSLMQAQRARHFFATEDSNAQLVFQASDGHILGDRFTAAGALTLRAAVHDPSAEGVARIEIWRGQIGAGVPAAPHASVDGQASLTIQESPTGAYYYYVHAVQADGHDLWSAPMWIDFGGGGGGGGTSADVSGWTLTQANSTYNFTIPAGTTIPAGGYLVVGRNATKAAFEGFWGALPAGVVYLNAADAMPIINGSETFTLRNGTGGTEDGPTIAMSSGAGQSLRRNDPCQAAGTAASWTVGATTTGNPGSGAGAGCGTGVVINEFSDTAGTGNYVYEFVELHNDTTTAPPPDTQAPATAITSPTGGTVTGTVAVSASASDNVGVSSVTFLLDGVAQATDATSPYSWSWNTTTAANGAHTLTSRAVDAAGNTTTSSPVSVTVSNAGPELLVNGGFEGSSSPWVRATSFNWTGGGGAQAGTGYVLNASSHNLNTSAYQAVAIPASASGAATFWTHITTAETTTTTAYDKLLVEVRSTSGTLLATLATYSNLNKSTGWVQRSVSLAAYKGQTVRLQFRVTTDVSLASVFRVDSVSLK